MKYIASCSFGKDSLAMVLLLMEKGYPLDEVVFYDTGMEFNAIYHNRDLLVPLLQERGISYVELHPSNPFEYDMLYRPVCSKQKGKHSGYGWCGGVSRWGTTSKTKIIDRYKLSLNEEITEYIGIAADEPKRVRDKNYPLIEWGMTELDCLSYCYKNGWHWFEQTRDDKQIELYDVLDRVSCWCCCNKNRKELKNIYLFLPEYWEKLKTLQAQIERPMKKFVHNGISYGNVFDMEKIFENEIISAQSSPMVSSETNNKAINEEQEVKT